MKYITLLFLFFISSTARAEVADSHLVYVSADTLAGFPFFLTERWLYEPGDDTLYAATNYDDGDWPYASTPLNLTDSSPPVFPGIAWFRLHLHIDSTLAGQMLALSMEHFGASEIYMDGKRIHSYGKIQGKDSSEYYDPQDLPFTLILPDTGRHVLAVRYANYEAQHNHLKFRYHTAGFRMMMGTADNLITHKNLKSTVLSAVFMLLNGIFLTLSLLHLFMYLFYRKERSNLFFSMFMFCLAVATTIAFICNGVPVPAMELWSIYFSNSVICLSCLSLSGFINELFSRRRLRFRIIAFLCLLTMLTRFVLPGTFVFAILTVGLMGAVSLEAVILIVWAVTRRIRGARIIGTGVLFFALFVLTIFGILVVARDLEINDSTAGGRILLLFMALAILSIPLSMSIYQAWSFARTNKDLALQLQQVQALSEQTIRQEKEKQQMLENRKEELEREVDIRTQELRLEKKKSDDLLLNILPTETAEELKETGAAQARSFPAVTVMFTDFKDFTQATEKLGAEELVEVINACYSAFDKIISRHNIEKIKTMGDSYMCAGGLPVNNTTHPSDVVMAALEMQEFIRNHGAERKSQGRPYFELRLGIHTGPVVAGIVGIKKFAYDIWGDTVNTASRMESSGEAGKINVSGATHAFIRDRFRCTYRGKIVAKNKGEIDMYFVDGLREADA